MDIIIQEKVERGYEWTCLGHNHYGNIKCKGRYSVNEDEFIEYLKLELKKEQNRNINYLEEYVRSKNERIENIDIVLESLQEEFNDINTQIFELRKEKNEKLILVETYESQIKILDKRLEEIRDIENEYKNLWIDLKQAEQRYNEQREVLDNLDFNHLTNMQLKTIFNQIKIMGEIENGYKKMYVHFSYNVIDTTRIELLTENINGTYEKTECFMPYKEEKIRKSTKTRYFD